MLQDVVVVLHVLLAGAVDGVVLAEQLVVSKGKLFAGDQLLFTLGTSKRKRMGWRRRKRERDTDQDLLEAFHVKDLVLGPHAIVVLVKGHVTPAALGTIQSVWGSRLREKKHWAALTSYLT